MPTQRSSSADSSSWSWPSLDAALEWAARCPAAAYGAVEVRPLAPQTKMRIVVMSGAAQEAVHRTIERVARESYGRLVANLSARTGDLASAEDALGDALVSALTHWPADGVPQNPEAWLMTAARHTLIDAMRHHRVVLARPPTVALLNENFRRSDLANRVSR